MRRRVARADIGQFQAAIRAADDPHARNSALRSVAGSASAAGSGLIPCSIIRLPTM